MKREDLTARGGLALVLETMRALGVDKEAEKHLPAAKRESSFGPSEKLESLVMLVAAGGDRIEDIRILSEDKGLERALEQPFPSPDTLLNFLNSFHDEKIIAEAKAARPEDKITFVPPESKALLGLAAVNLALVAKAAEAGSQKATIDFDGTIIEAHKREAKRAYEGTVEYQPLVAVWSEQQLIVADEFRDGNVGGGEDPLSCAKRAFEALPKFVSERYFRGDSACYHEGLLKYLVLKQIGFTISADMTVELRAEIIRVASTHWHPLEKRAAENVDWAEVEFTPGNWNKKRYSDRAADSRADLGASPRSECRVGHGRGRRWHGDCYMGISGGGTGALGTQPAERSPHSYRPSVIVHVRRARARARARARLSTHLAEHRNHAKKQLFCSTMFNEIRPRGAAMSNTPG